MPIIVDNKLDDIMKIYTLLSDDSQKEIWILSKELAQKEKIVLESDTFE